MVNQEVNQQIISIYNGFKMSNEAVSNYLDNWFDNLPIEGKQDVMGDYNTPEHDEFNPEYYEYAVAEYIDKLYSEFADSSTKMKLNDFKQYAQKYADRMQNNFTF